MEKLLKGAIQAKYRWANAFGQIILMKFLSKRYFDMRTIYERVRTFEDACQELGCSHELVMEYLLLKELGVSKDILAMSKLKIITKALNEGWPDNADKIEWRGKKYFPNLRARKEGGMLLSYVSSMRADHFGAPFYYRTEELAKYSVNTFTDIWTDLYGGEHIEDKIKEDDYDFDYDMA